MNAPHFLLIFGTTQGRSRLLRINNPDLSTTNAQMRTAMDGMISSQVVSGPSGNIETARRASFVETLIQPIAITTP